MGIEEYCQESLCRYFFSSYVWFYPRSLGHRTSGPWHSRQCQSWAQSCGMGLRLEESLVVHAHNLHVALITERSIGRAGCRLKDVRLGQSPNPFTGSLAGDGQFRLYVTFFQVSQLGSSLQSSGSFPCTRFLPDFEMMPFPAGSFCPFSPHSTPSVPYVPIPTLLQFTHEIFLFPPSLEKVKPTGR